MSTAELDPTTLPPLGDGSPIIDRYSFAIDGQPFVADISNYGDERLAQARRIEEVTFTSLGDLPEEVQEEFNPHDPFSVFIFLHAGSISDAKKPITSEMVGMGRLLPYNPLLGGNKTFVDLGKIAAQTPETESGDENSSTRSRILDALGIEIEYLATLTDLDERSSYITGEVEKSFKETYGAEDLGLVVDIATLAPDMGLKFTEKIGAIEGLLAAMAIYTTDLYLRHRLTHLVQFTSGPLHHFLRDLYGYPVMELFGLSDLSYDSFGNGTNSNMLSTPSVLNSHQLVEDVFFAEVPPTKHIGKIATAISQVRQARALVS